MAQITLRPPMYNSQELNTGDSEALGDSPKKIVDSVNAMMGELYGIKANQGSRFALFSDSRGINGVQNDAGNVKAVARGFLNRSSARLGRRLRHDPRFYSDGGDCYAITGNTFPQLVAAGLPAAIVAAHQANSSADPYAGVFCLASTNGRADVVLETYAATVAAAMTFRNAMVAANIPIIWLDELPRNDAGVAGWGANGQRDIHQQFSNWLRSRNGLPGEKTLSVFSRMADQTSAIAAPVTAYFADLLHPNQLGADVMADPIVQYLDPILAAGGSILPVGPADLFSANNPSGCMNVNPWMTGTGGTVAGTGISGVLPDSYTSSYAGSGTAACVFSKYTHTDGSVWVKAVLSGTPAGNGTSISIAIPNVTGHAPGDVIDVVVETMVDAGQVGLNRFGIGCFDGGALGGAKNRSDMAIVSSADVMWSPAVQRREIQRIPRFVINTAGTLGFSMAISPLNVACNATVYFRALAVRKNLAFNF